MTQTPIRAEHRADAHVLLIGNYPLDRQESMLRFATLLQEGLRERGVKVTMIAPQPVFGRLLNYTGRGLGKWLGYLDKFILFPRTLRAALRSAPAGTIVHICDHSNAGYVRTIQSWPHVVTCHDVLAIRSALGHFPQNPTSASGRQLQRWILTGLRSAACVVCDTDETSRQLLALGSFDPVRIQVAKLSLNWPFLPLPREESGATLQTLPAIAPFADRDFVFHVGGNQWYKNRAGVLRIYFEYVRQGGRQPLVMAGKPFTEEMRGLVAQQPAGATVIELGAVTNEQLNALYCRAGCLLFPSLWEGFGWPVLEALASGCRVLTTNKAPMTEVGGAAAGYFEEGDEPAAARLLARILAETSAERKKQEATCLAQARCFSAASLFNRYLEIYAGLTTPPRPGQPRPESLMNPGIA